MDEISFQQINSALSLGCGFEDDSALRWSLTMQEVEVSGKNSGICNFLC